MDYWSLVDEARRLGVPPAKRNDAAIVLASRGHTLPASDSWAACYALEMGVNVVYVSPLLD